jgi:hypothetical protein
LIDRSLSEDEIDIQKGAHKPLSKSKRFFKFMDRLHPKRKIEFGDFQTSPQLSSEIASFIRSRIEGIKTIVEPTCGEGNLLYACLDRFPGCRSALGVEVQEYHWRKAVARRTGYDDRSGIQIRHEDFFSIDWSNLLAGFPDPLLVVGNPPWVTNSELASLGSGNLPVKSNTRLGGMAALTGKSNFDISESILRRIVGGLQGRRATLAVLCKAGVARKVIAHLFDQSVSASCLEIRRIDANFHFGAAVDACLLFIQFGECVESAMSCQVYDSLTSSAPTESIGFIDGVPIANLSWFNKRRSLMGKSPHRWRSGIKHDCSAIMEFKGVTDPLFNQLDEAVSVEKDLVYPLLKSSDLGRLELPAPRLSVLVTQRAVGEDTSLLRESHPKAWSYLENHGDRLDRRASSIYRGKPRFAIFGVGPYTFMPWKVAVSGMYKSLHFHVVPPFLDRPVVFDDTCYFLSFRHEAQAHVVQTLLHSEPAQEFLRSLIFWDSKRPVTAETLNNLDLRELANELGLAARFDSYFPADKTVTALLWD